MRSVSCLEWGRRLYGAIWYSFTLNYRSTKSIPTTAFRTITAATQHSATTDGHIQPTRNEISRLVTTTIHPTMHTDPLRWSAWRRRHQYCARTSGKPPPNNQRHDQQLEY